MSVDELETVVSHEEVVPIASLTPHPENYREHPPEQMEHLKASIQQHGIYRRIVVVNGYVIVAGHGVWQAATELGVADVPIIRLELDPYSVNARKILAGDNESGKLAKSNEELLLELLQHVATEDDLMGTGYNEEMMASLAAMAGQLGEYDQSAEWTGMPEYEQEDVDVFKTIMVHFDTVADVEAFARAVGQTVKMATKSIWFPPQERMVTSDIGYIGGSDDD